MLHYGFSCLSIVEHSTIEDLVGLALAEDGAGEVEEKVGGVWRIFDHG
jgi:hypothetical protein